MKSFHTIATVLLIGVFWSVLASKTNRYNHVTSKKAQSSVVSLQQHKEIVGHVVSALQHSVADVVGEHTTRSGGHRKKGIPGTFPLNHNNNFEKAPSEPIGVTKVLIYKSGLHCTGAALKNWIILTAASCFNKSELSNLEPIFVEVIIKNGTGYSKVPVEVHSITLNPLYQEGNPDYNQALMHVFSNLSWDMNTYQLPRYSVTPDKLKLLNLSTFSSEWFLDKYDNITVKFVHRQITDDFLVCDEIGDNTNWYCAELKDSNERRRFLKTDIGTPLYVKVGNLKRLIGLYTGRVATANVSGIIFQSIFPSLDWIETYVHEHPVPPFYY